MAREHDAGLLVGVQVPLARPAQAATPARIGTLRERDRCLVAYVARASALISVMSTSVGPSRDHPWWASSVSRSAALLGGGDLHVRGCVPWLV